MGDAPYELPAPSVVADLLAQRAWDDDVDDDTRLLCEMGADTIRTMMAGCVRLRKLFEVIEAKYEALEFEVEEFRKDLKLPERGAS